MAGEPFAAVVCQHADVVIDVHVVGRAANLVRDRALAVARQQYALLG